jgi:integrase
MSHADEMKPERDDPNALVPTNAYGGLVDDHAEGALARAGRVANHYAASGVFQDYLSRKADNTIRRQAADLARFADYLADAGINSGDLQHNPDAWRGVTWGLVEGFRNWMIAQGDAVGSVNVRLSTVKSYTKLAAKAGAVSAEQSALIQTVSGYSRREAQYLDERRDTTRRGDKKAEAVHMDCDQAQALKDQPDTPQGRRDAVLMCLLLDHGLRVGEVARLQVTDFDLKEGEMCFYRPKVDKVQTHKLTADTQRAIQAWFDSGDAPVIGPLLRGSRKGGVLTDAGMSARAITDRVRALGERIGIEGLSAHDCRHYWATYWAGKVDVLRLQEAGGWSSLAMPRRYVEESQIANQGMA